MSEDRKEKAKEDVLGKLSKEEREMIKHKRKFDGADKGTYSYDLLVELDPVGKRLNDDLRELEHALVVIEDGYAKIKRMKVELTTGNITSVGKDGNVLTKEELELKLKFDENKLASLVSTVPNGLYDIRTKVGAKDHNGNEWFTIEQFDELCKNTEDRINKIGYKLFSRRV